MSDKSNRKNGSSAAKANGGLSRCEILLAGYVERLTAGEPIDVDAIRREHPELAEELIEQLRLFEGVFEDSPASAPLGTLGDYTLRRQIGRGGMGVVYEAWQGSMDRVVALKVLPPAVAADDRAYGRFMQEARAAGKLSHPNVVAVHASGQDESTPYYAMEYVEGETLAQVLARTKDAEPQAETPFGPKDQVDYFAKLARAFADVADGLQHAHSKGVTHRDIKPSNLILDADGRLRILDFGLARLEGQESLTLSGDFVGTPLYMSPEQARRKKIPVDHRTDVYSLGATMYEAICGRPPFRGKDHADTLSQIIEGNPVDPRKTNPRLPRDLETIVLKCLRKDAGDRYGTAEALAQDLRRFVRGDAIEARSPRRTERALHWIRWHRTSVAFGFLFVLAALLFGLVLRGWQRERHVGLEVGHTRILEDVARDLTWVQQFREVFENKSDQSPPIVEWKSAFLSRLPESRVKETLTRVQERLAEAERLRPGHPKALYLFAVSERLEGRHDSSLAAVDRLIDTTPGNVLAFDLKASLLAETGQDEAAARTREIAVALTRTPEEKTWLRARQAFEDRRWRSAVDIYTELFAMRDRSGLVVPESKSRVERGLAHLKLKETQAAGWDFQAAAGFDPKLFGPALLVGKAFTLEGDFAAAEAWLQSWFDATPAALRDEFALQCADFWSIEGRLDDEAAHREPVHDRILEWIERLSEGAVKERSLCQFYLEFRTDVARALAAGRAAAHLDRDSAEGHVLLAGVYANLPGEQQTARRELEMAMNLAPRDTELLIRVSLCLHELTRYSEGADVAWRALAIEKENDGALRALATNLDYLGKRGESEAIWLKIVERRPSDPDAWGYLSSVQYKIGKYKYALASSQRAVDLAPNDTVAHLRVGNVFMAMGEAAKALPSYKKARDLSPRSRWSQWCLGNAYRALGCYDQALTLYCTALPQAAVFEHHASGSWFALAALLRGVPRPSNLSPLDGFLSFFEENHDIDALPFFVREVLALAYVHAPSKRDPQKALRIIQETIDSEGWHRRPALAVTLASVHFHDGRVAEAIRVLEDQIDLESMRAYRPLIDAYRETLRPDIASVASVDSLFSNVDEIDLPKALTDFAALEATPERQLTARYFGARLLEREGRCDAAVAELDAVLTKRSANAGTPIVRLGPCLEKSSGLQDVLLAACREALATRAPDGVLSRALSALEALASPGDSISAVGGVHVWWVLGPFANMEDATQDLVGADGFDLNETFEHDGKAVTWKRHVCASVHLDRRGLFRSLWGRSFLLSCEFDVPRRLNARIVVGGNDPVRLRLNGEEIGRFESSPVAYSEDQVCNAVLRSGTNRLTVQIKNTDGRSGLSIRFEDENGFPIRVRQRL